MRKTWFYFFLSLPPVFISLSLGKEKRHDYIFNRSAQNMSIGFLTRVKICFPILFPKQRCIDALSDDAFAERLRTPLGPICLISSFSDATVLNIS